MPPSNPSPLSRLGAWIAFVLPFAVTIGRLTGEGHWTDDLPAVRALTLLQVGADGLVSAALGSALQFIPLGDRVFRLELLSAGAVGAAGLLTFRLFEALVPEGWDSRVRAGVGVLAALAATLGPAWQAIGSGVGRGAVAEDLLLLVFLSNFGRRGERFWGLQGALLGLLFVEQRLLLIPAAATLLVTATARRAPPSPADVVRLASVALGVVGIALCPSLFDRVNASGGPNLGLDLAVPAKVFGGGASFLSALGTYQAVLAVVGLIGLGLTGRLAAVGGAVTLSAFAILSHASGVPAAVSVGAALAGVGLLRAFGWLETAKLRFLRAGLGTLGLLHFAVTLMSAEEGRHAVSQHQVNGTRAWSREMFDHLPPRSLLLVQSTDAVWRLWAAQTIEATRPDVMIVPAPLLTHGSVARNLLQAEPKLGRLVRDLAATGAAGEYALSEIADTRPVRAELDESWGAPVLSHLVSDGLWFRLAPEALGRTDRSVGITSVTGALDRVVAQARTERGYDDATLARVIDDAFKHGIVAAALGERNTARVVLEPLARLAPSDARVRQLSELLDREPRGAVDVSGVLSQR